MATAIGWRVYGNIRAEQISDKRCRVGRSRPARQPERGRGQATRRLRAHAA
jgi:hypothetical protein